MPVLTLLNAFLIRNKISTKYMSKVDYYIQEGLISKKARSVSTKGDGLFSLVKFFKKMLTRFHIVWVDDCCDPADVTNLPIRYNRTAAKLQYFNPDNDTWTNLTTF